MINLTELILDPEKSYSEAVYADVKVPQQPDVKYQIAKDVYIRSLSIPIPNDLYVGCRNCRKQPHCLNTALWNVSDGQVVMNQEVANQLIDSQSIYCSDPNKQVLIKNLVNLCDLLNKCNEGLSGELLRPNPVTTEFCRGKFIIQDEYVGNNYKYKIAIDPEFLRSLVQD